jgi:preprotein translocase subunit SecA
MLGGNPEFLSRNDLKKVGFSDETIAEAVGHAETDDEEILDARRQFNENFENHKRDTDADADRVRAVGGLFIVGTERHESRRIDNQLRGRAGRQGDPGETRFYISMTDDIMRLFGSERIMNMMDSLGIDEDTPIDQKILSNAIENAQRRVESRNFQSRKSVLEYDDVMNTQRSLIYEQRGKVLNGDDLKENIFGMIQDVVRTAVNEGSPTGEIEAQSQLDEIAAQFEGLFLRRGELKLPDGGYSREALIDALLSKAYRVYDEREREYGLLPEVNVPVMRELERVVMLRVVDEYWMEHIDAMEELRDGVRLRAYGQVNPVDEYKREGFEMFEAMINGIRDEVVRRVFVTRVQTARPLERKGVSKNAAIASNVGGDDSVKKQPVKRDKKVGPNDPCPCGKKRPNGLPMKYKNCCGREA